MGVWQRRVHGRPECGEHAGSRARQAVTWRAGCMSPGCNGWLHALSPAAEPHLHKDAADRRLKVGTVACVGKPALGLGEGTVGRRVECGAPSLACSESQ